MTSSLTLDIPKKFEERVISTFGFEGRHWLKNLPHQVCEYLVQWNLKISGHFEELSFNFVAPVLRLDGSSAVLKLGLHPVDRLREIAALNYFSGNGMIKVLEFDQKTGASLLERPMLGKTLKNLFLENDEDLANQIACSVILKLQSSPRPKNLSSFNTVTELGRGFRKFLDKSTSISKKFETKILEAESLFRDLIRTTEQSVVLHADLHHSNILSSERDSYLAIDPKGVVGDSAYELGAWIRNPMPEILVSSGSEYLLFNRICSMSDALNFDRKRVWGWAYSQAWLAVVWALEDGDKDSDSWIQIAQILDGIKEKF